MHLKTPGRTILATPGMFRHHHDLVGLICVETPDRFGEIIRVAGIETKPSVPLVGGSGRYAPMDNGEFPQVGTVREFARTTVRIEGQGIVPALAFAADYATEGGAVTKYAATFKAAYDSGRAVCFMSSLDLLAHDRKGGARIITESRLFAVACSCPEVPAATRLKSLMDVPLSPQDIAALAKSIDNIKEQIEEAAKPRDPLEALRRSIARCSDKLAVATRPKHSR